MNQGKFENTVLFICENTPGEMNTVRLNKLLWLIDKTSFLKLAHTVTGRHYIRKEMGPAPVYTHDAISIMRDKGLINVTHISDENGHKCSYTPLTHADLSRFSADEQKIMRDVLAKYGSAHWLKLVELSHDLAWATYEDGETIPFEAYLSAPREGSSSQAIRALIEREENQYAGSNILNKSFV